MSLDTSCEVRVRRSALNMTGRCGAESDGEGNMSLNDYCLYCSRNMCDYHLARHLCREAKRAGKKRGECAADHGASE